MSIPPNIGLSVRPEPRKSVSFDEGAFPSGNPLGTRPDSVDHNHSDRVRVYVRAKTAI